MLIDEIIDLLSDESKSLSEALLKAKVLLYKIGKMELAEWINHELNGYPDSAVVPQYRVLQSKVLANVVSITMRYTEHPVPIGHLDPEELRHLESGELRQPLSVIENFGTTGQLSRDLPIEGNQKLGAQLANGFYIERAWCVTPAHDIRGVLTQIRSRLLDFLLELKATIGDSKDDDSIKRKAETVDTTVTFKQTTFGANTTIVIGDHNTQNVRNDIARGDLNTLTTTLAKAGFPSDEIENLKAAILEDEEKGQSEPFEGMTGNWFMRLMGRAAKGGLNFGTDVASKVGTDALVSYFGGGSP